MRRDANGGWSGDMFDGAGLLAALEGLGQSATGRRVTLIGAGGAGSAIAMALAAAGAASLHICDLMPERADRLAGRVARFYPSCRATAGAATVEGADLLVNATPIGMAPDYGMPPVVGALGPGITVIDIVPSPAETQLLKRAQQAGCPVANGPSMTAGQSDAVLRYLGFGQA